MKNKQLFLCIFMFSGLSLLAMEIEYDKSIENISEEKRKKDYWFFNNQRTSDIKIEIRDNQISEKEGTILYSKLLKSGKKVKILLEKMKGKNITLRVWDFFTTKPWITRSMDYQDLTSNFCIYPKYIFKDQKQQRTDVEHFMARKRLIASFVQPATDLPAECKRFPQWIEMNRRQDK